MAVSSAAVHPSEARRHARAGAARDGAIEEGAEDEQGDEEEEEEGQISCAAPLSQESNAGVAGADLNLSSASVVQQVC